MYFEQLFSVSPKTGNILHLQNEYPSLFQRLSVEESGVEGAFRRPLAKKPSPGPGILTNQGRTILCPALDKPIVQRTKSWLHLAVIPLARLMKAKEQPSQNSGMNEATTKNPFGNNRLLGQKAFIIVGRCYRAGNWQLQIFY